MHKTCLPPIHRIAAIGSAVAIVAASSAFGIGVSVSSASADESVPDTSVVTSTGADASTGVGATTGVGAPATGPTDPAVGSTSGADAAPGETGRDHGVPTPAATPAPTTTPTAPAAPAAPTVPRAPATTTTVTPVAVTPVAVTPTAAAAPSATAAGTVAVTGTATTWHTLRAVTDGWPAGTTFTYQWTLSGPVVGTRVIAGATSETYVLGHPDATSDLTVAVTGTAPGEDPTTVTSAPVHADFNNETTFTGAGVRELTARAGETISVPIQALTGDQGSLRYGVSSSADGPIDAAALPAGLTLSSDGVLSGSTTTAQVVDFWVLARTSQEPAGAPGQHVQLTVGLAADTQLRAFVTDYDPPHSRSWTVSADGTTEYLDALSDDQAPASTPITSTVGSTITVNTGLVDRYGNRQPIPVIDDDWASSVAGDTLGKYDPGTAVTFSSPGVRTLTGTAPDGRTISFTVGVAATATTATPTTPAAAGGTASGTGSPGSGSAPSGHLAFTGADETGPIAWALGLLAAGAALLVARVRRRRA